MSRARMPACIAGELHVHRLGSAQHIQSLGSRSAMLEEREEAAAPEPNHQRHVTRPHSYALTLCQSERGRNCALCNSDAHRTR